MSQREKKSDGGDDQLLMTAVASSALSQDAQEEILPLLKTLLQKRMVEEEKLEERQQKWAAEAVRMAEEEEKNKHREKMSCNHRRQNGTPRTGGQVLSDGSIHIVCQWCQRAATQDIEKGWVWKDTREVFPRDLLPSGDMIGRAIAG